MSDRGGKGRGKRKKQRRFTSALTFSDWTVVCTRQEADGGTGWPLEESGQMRADLSGHALLCHIHGETQEVFAMALSRIHTRALLPAVMLPVLRALCRVDGLLGLPFHSWSWRFGLQNSLQPSPLFSLKGMCQTACLLCPRPPHRTAAPVLCSIQAS